jgi:hypothetical protein
MTDSRQGQPALDKIRHAIPKDATVLAAPQQCVAAPGHLVSKPPERWCVYRHTILPDVSIHRLQQFALFGDGFVLQYTLPG